MRLIVFKTTRQPSHYMPDQVRFGSGRGYFLGIRGSNLMQIKSTVANRLALRQRCVFLGALFSMVTLVFMAPLTAIAADGRSDAPAKNKSSAKSTSVVIIGASYAKGWNPSELGGLNVINRGAGGEQTHEILARFDKDVLAPAPRAVIIWGFINDIFRSTPEELDKKLIRSRENLIAMIDKAHGKGIIPILATEVTLPASDNWLDQIAAWVGTLRGKKSYQDYINGHVIEMNQWLRRVATERKLTLLDFEKTLADENGRRRIEYTTQDGTHLSPKAYAALTDSVKNLNFRR